MAVKAGWEGGRDINYNVGVMPYYPGGTSCSEDERNKPVGIAESSIG